MGTSGFGRHAVRGARRVPRPAARIRVAVTPNDSSAPDASATCALFAKDAADAADENAD
jgi:hypothetical protein